MKRQHLLSTSALLATALILTSSLASCSSDSGGAASSDCAPKHEFETVKNGSLTVVLYDLPPFSKLEGSSISGVDGDVLTAFAEEECLTISATAAATAANIPAVQAGRADVSIAAWYRTKAREDIVGLTDPLYLDQMAIVSPEGITNIDDLAGKKVGTVDGYQWADDMRKMLGDSLKVYPNTVNLYQDLKAGRIDYGLDSYGSAVFNNADNRYQVKVTDADKRVKASQVPAQIAIPVAPKNTGLLEALNDFIADIHKDGRLETYLTDNGLDASAGDTGPARLN